MYYREEDRGIIQNQKNFHQKVLFEGIRYGKCMPTDIDAIIEFDGKLLVIYELKYSNATMPYGQRLILERMANAWQDDGGEAVVFLCRHMTPSSEDIELGDTVVTNVYYNREWRPQKVVRRAKEMTDRVIRWAEKTHGWKLVDDEGLCQRVL